MLRISNQIILEDSEIEWQAIGAQGAGGQNVNKTASAIHLRFDIGASSLPEVYKQRLLERADQRISQDGVVVVKAQRYRSQSANHADALARLKALLRSATAERKTRKPTRPSRAARRKRREDKRRRGRTKALRSKPARDD